MTGVLGSRLLDRAGGAVLSAGSCWAGVARLVRDVGLLLLALLLARWPAGPYALDRLLTRASDDEEDE